MGRHTLALACYLVALVGMVPAEMTEYTPFTGEPDDQVCKCSCPPSYRDCCLDGGEGCCEKCQETYARFLLAAQIAVGAALVLALVALVSVIWRTYVRRGRAAERRARQTDAESVTSQERFVAQMLRDCPPAYEAVVSQDKPPSYRNLQNLQIPANPESSAPRSPGTQLRSRSNASIVSNPPPYDEVSLQIEQTPSTPSLQEAPEGATAVHPAATQAVQQERRVQWIAGDESQDEEEIYSKITPSDSTHTDSTCRNRNNQTEEGCVNLAFNSEEKEVEGEQSTSDRNN